MLPRTVPDLRNVCALSLCGWSFWSSIDETREWMVLYEKHSFRLYENSHSNNSFRTVLQWASPFEEADYSHAVFLYSRLRAGITGFDFICETDITIKRGRLNERDNLVNSYKRMGNWSLGWLRKKH